MNENELLELINNHITYCDSVIKTEAINFNPFAVMMGTESKSQKLYRFCCEFLNSMSELCLDFTETLKNYL